MNANSRPTVLMVGTVFPEPVDTGKKVVLSGFLRYFRDSCPRLGFTYACVGPIPELQRDGFWVAPLQLSAAFRRVTSIMIHSLLLRKKTLQEAALYSTHVQKQIHCLIRSKRPDIVVFDTIRMAQFGVPDEYQGRVIVYLEDLFSLRYRGMLKAANVAPEALRGVLGNFAKFLPIRLTELVDRSNWIKRRLLSWESALAEQSEVREAQRAWACLLLNGQESSRLQAVVPASRQITIKPLTEMVATPSRKPELARAPCFIFIGTLTIPQNSVAIERFIKTCWAEVRHTISGATLQVIGGGTPSSVLQSQVAQHDGSIQLLGFVPNLGDSLAQCCAMIVPLLFGSGVKLKIIEALAYGVPIVSTPVGLDGVAIAAGAECLVAEELEAFPKLMAKLTDAATNHHFSSASRRVYDLHYSPEVVTAEYSRLFVAP